MVPNPILFHCTTTGTLPPRNSEPLVNKGTHDYAAGPGNYTSSTLWKCTAVVRNKTTETTNTILADKAFLKIKRNDN